MADLQKPIVEARGVTKRYPGVVALDHVDFALEAGEVHVLFGENGAGKSTLISILAGASTPTSGSVEIAGHPVTVFTVRNARKLGVSAVFQEFSLVPTQTVLENLVLGEEPASAGFLRRAEGRRRAEALFATLERGIDLDRSVSQLSRGEQQLVEIAKAMRGDLRVLILDEPTASLSDRETEVLFGLISRLKARGVGIIYISHRIHEFERIADRITVLRDGHKLGTVPSAGLSEEKLLAMMTGRVLGAIYPSIGRPGGPEVLKVEGLRASGVAGASFAIRAGEVTGFAGLIGSGKSRVWRAVMGLSRTLGGRLILNGKDMTGARTAAIIAAGVHYLPPDRKTEGLVLVASAFDNIALGMLGTDSGRGRRAVEAIAGIAKTVGFDRHMLRRFVSQLSGGNQQKVLFGKGFGRDYAIYVFDEPTVGVDMGTRAQLYRVIKSLAESSKAVVVISSDLQEAMTLSHRLLVFSAGEISAEFEGDEINEAAVLPHFFERRKPAA
ncbi:MAG TPA: sugar ABC transporter ATP-binding protein [Roseiarcus sp.]